MNKQCSPTARSANTREWSIPVDTNNPSHFYGCCGIAEIASCLTVNAATWWDEENFHFQGDLSLKAILDKFKEARVTQRDPRPGAVSGQDLNMKSKPISLDLEVGSIFIDWYSDAKLKGWTGAQSICSMFNQIRELIDSSSSSPFHEYTNEARCVPPGLDSRRVNSDSNFLGFSADELRKHSAICPAAETLPVVGLQRMCVAQENGNYRYCTWREPLHIRAASAVARGNIDGLTCQTFWWYPHGTSERGHKKFAPAELAPSL